MSTAAEEPRRHGAEKPADDEHVEREPLPTPDEEDSGEYTDRDVATDHRGERIETGYTDSEIPGERSTERP